MLLVSAYVAFNGWPGSEAELKRHRVFIPAAAAGKSERDVALPTPEARNARKASRPATRRRARLRPRARQRVKAHRAEGFERATPSPEAMATEAPLVKPVDEAIDSLQGTVRKVLPPVSEAADPIIDKLQDPLITPKGSDPFGVD